jgi:hypothetical protein
VVLPSFTYRPGGAFGWPSDENYLTSGMSGQGESVSLRNQAWLLKNSFP